MKKATRRIVEECNERILNMDLTAPYEKFRTEWRQIEADEASYEKEEFVRLRREIFKENPSYKKSFNQKLSKIINKMLMLDTEVEDEE